MNAPLALPIISYDSLKNSQWSSRGKGVYQGI